MDAKKSTKKKEDDNLDVGKGPADGWLANWNEFDEERFEYIDWRPIDANSCQCIINFESDAPTKFVNKWGREQWKILVRQEGSLKWLSGGKRLFEAIKRLCKESELPPTKFVNYVRINRIGKSVQCSYSAEVTDLQIK